MNCKEVRDLASDYIDNELTESDRIAFEDHMADCSDCAEEVMMMMSMTQALNNMEEDPLPADFHLDLMGRLEGVEQDKLNLENIVTISNEVEKANEAPIQTIKQENKILKFLRPKVLAPLVTAACLAFVVLAWNENDFDNLEPEKYSSDSISESNSLEMESSEISESAQGDMSIDSMNESKFGSADSKALMPPATKGARNQESYIIENGVKSTKATIANKPEVFINAIRLVNTKYDEDISGIDFESFFMVPAEVLKKELSGLLVNQEASGTQTERIIRLSGVELIEGTIKIDIALPDGTVLKTYTLSVTQNEQGEDKITLEDENQ